MLWGSELSGAVLLQDIALLELPNINNDMICPQFTIGHRSFYIESKHFFLRVVDLTLI